MSKTTLWTLTINILLLSRGLQQRIHGQVHQNVSTHSRIQQELKPPPEVIDAIQQSPDKTHEPVGTYIPSKHDEPAMYETKLAPPGSEASAVVGGSNEPRHIRNRLAHEHPHRLTEFPAHAITRDFLQTAHKVKNRPGLVVLFPAQNDSWRYVDLTAHWENRAAQAGNFGDTTNFLADRQQRK
eukprot:scaffold310569_cov17-Tisochrysis_lutea.AAC.1